MITNQAKNIMILQRGLGGTCIIDVSCWQKGVGGIRGGGKGTWQLRVGGIGGGGWEHRKWVVEEVGDGYGKKGWVVSGVGEGGWKMRVGGSGDKRRGRKKDEWMAGRQGNEAGKMDKWKRVHFGKVSNIRLDEWIAISTVQRPTRYVLPHGPRYNSWCG